MPKTSPESQRASMVLSAQIAARVERELEERQLQQRDLAKAAGIDRTTLNKMLRGKLPISMTNAALLAKALQLELSALTANVDPSKKLTSPQSAGDSTHAPVEPTKPAIGRGAFIERHRRDLSPNEVDFIRGVEFPEACAVPEDEEFLMHLLIGYRAARLRNLPR